MVSTTSFTGDQIHEKGWSFEVRLPGYQMIQAVSHGPKNTGTRILSMKYWLFNRDPYNGLL